MCSDNILVINMESQSLNDTIFGKILRFAARIIKIKGINFLAYEFTIGTDISDKLN